MKNAKNLQMPYLNFSVYFACINGILHTLNIPH